MPISGMVNVHMSSLLMDNYCKDCKHSCIVKFEHRTWQECRHLSPSASFEDGTALWPVIKKEETACGDYVERTLDVDKASK